MAERTGIIVQARMGSTRLPGKVMMEISGKPMLLVLIERLRRSKLAGTTIIATTDNRLDDPIALCAHALKIALYRGDELDVLARYYGAAKAHKLDIVVRVTADCPLSDPYLIDEMIRSFLSSPGISYLSNTITRTYPRGFDAEVFSFSALEDAYKKAKKDHEREHVTPYIYGNVPVKAYLCDGDSSAFRVTVDTEDDLRLVNEIFKALGNISFIRWGDVVRLLRQRPDLVEINSHIQQKNGPLS